jgi:hypothetical protein
MNFWDNISKGIDKNKPRYMKLVSGHKYKIRPLGIPYEIKKYLLKHNEQWRSAICLDVETCPVANKHNILPKDKCVMNVINRESGQIEILENYPNVFYEMANFYNKTGKNPGGTDGAHFELSVSGSGSSTKYTMKFLGPHILSEEDIALVKKNGLYDLKKIYRATDPNKIEQVLFGENGYKNDEKEVNVITGTNKHFSDEDVDNSISKAYQKEKVTTTLLDLDF